MAGFLKNLDVMIQVARINRNLKRIVDEVTPPVHDTMLTQASLIAGEMKRVAPVGGGDDKAPGSLRNSIRVEDGPSTAKKAIVIHIKAGGAKTTNLGEDHPYDYARAQEFGTTRNHAHPFFYPVYRARKKAAVAAIRKRMKDEVVKVFGRDD